MKSDQSFWPIKAQTTEICQCGRSTVTVVYCDPVDRSSGYCDPVDRGSVYHDPIYHNPVYWICTCMLTGQTAFIRVLCNTFRSVLPF